MAFVPYVRLVVAGVMRGGQTWSMGFSFLKVTQPSNADLFTWLGVMNGLTNTWLSAVPVATKFWDTSTQYNANHAYWYNAPGPALAQAQNVVTPVVGTNVTSSPGQLALVYSIRSGLGSRKYRGRVYMPLTGLATVATNGQVSSGDLGNASANFKTWVNAANLTTIGGAAVTFGIASKASGFTVPGQDVRIDSKVDTQRRRTDKILASNVSIAVF